MAWYSVRYRIDKWKNLEGVYISGYLKYGYSVLRFIDDGTYECEEISIIKSKLQSFDTILELGTGIGFISTYCAKKIGDKSVHTFEANPFMEPLIQEVFKRNKVNPNFQIALLGDKNSTNDFIAQRDFLASSQKDSSREGKKVSVPFLDLNETIKKNTPSYLVMDIEGNEFEVFSIIDFQTISKVQFELHPLLLKQEEIDFIFRKLAINNFVKDSLVSTEKNFFFERQTRLS